MVSETSNQIRDIWYTLSLRRYKTDIKNSIYDIKHFKKLVIVF